MKIGSRQAVTGLTPPQRGEAIVREVRPSVAAHPALSGMAQRLLETVILAPLGWLLLAPLFPLKFLPFICKRYTLTNRRLMIRRGLRGRGPSRRSPWPTSTTCGWTRPAATPSTAPPRSKSSPRAKRPAPARRPPTGSVPPQHPQRGARLGARQGGRRLRPGQRQAERRVTRSGDTGKPSIFVSVSRLTTNHQEDAMPLKVTLVQGGGIGLDQVPAVQHVLSAAGVPIEWDEHLAGWASLERGGAALPAEMLQSVRATGLALKTKLLPPPGPLARDRAGSARRRRAISTCSSAASWACSRRCGR